MKYENDLHLFSERIKAAMLKEHLIDEHGKPDIIALYNRLYPNQRISKDMIANDRQGVTDMTRSVRNWVNGKNYPKSIADIMDLCNALNCSADYLLSYNDCTNHDIQFIHDQTGLTEASIKKLGFYKNAEAFYPLLDVLNAFLRFQSFENVLYYTGEYQAAVRKAERLQEQRRARWREVESSEPENSGAYNWPYTGELDDEYTESEKNVRSWKLETNDAFTELIKKIEKDAKAAADAEQ